jgi:hypothetical protein
LIDTSGRALEALRTIWLHDPTGPLADDALMMTAVYQTRRGRYHDADHALSLLRTEYGRSELAPEAFVLGSQVKLAIYQGAGYDSRALEEADELIQSAAAMFPDHEGTRKLLADSQAVRELRAARDLERARYWRAKGKPSGVRIHCDEILRNYPETKAAETAQAWMDELDAREHEPPATLLSWLRRPLERTGTAPARARLDAAPQHPRAAAEGIPSARTPAARRSDPPARAPVDVTDDTEPRGAAGEDEAPARTAFEDEE